MISELVHSYAPGALQKSSSPGALQKSFSFAKKTISFANAYILRLVCKRRLFSANSAILQTRTNIYILQRARSGRARRSGPLLLMCIL